MPLQLRDESGDPRDRHHIARCRNPDPIGLIDDRLSLLESTAKGRISVPTLVQEAFHVYIEISTNSMRLDSKASVPAGGPFIFSSLVHNTPVPAGGLFIHIQRHS